MAARKFGYARSSKKIDRVRSQCEKLLALGCEEFFCDLRTGSSIALPARDLLLDSLKEGDTVVVTELSRISRSSELGLPFMRLLVQKGVGFFSLLEPDCCFTPEEIAMPKRVSLRAMWARKIFPRRVLRALKYKFAYVDSEHEAVTERILSHPNSAKAKSLPLDELEEAYRLNPCLLQILQYPEFEKFKSSYHRIQFLLEEAGLKSPSYLREALKIAKEFTQRAAARNI